jgi:hypothetical protein
MHEADHLPPATSEVKNSWNVTSTSLYISLILCIFVYQILKTKYKEKCYSKYFYVKKRIVDGCTYGKLSRYKGVHFNVYFCRVWYSFIHSFIHSMLLFQNAQRKNMIIGHCLNVLKSRNTDGNLNMKKLTSLVSYCINEIEIL